MTQLQPDPSSEPTLDELLCQHWAEVYKVPEIPSYQELDALLDRTKGMLFFKKRASFLATLLCSHAFMWDIRTPTASCNGSTIKWNPYFFYGCTVEGRATILGHEVWHTAFDHMARLGDRHPRIWNYAADHVINLIMLEDGFTFSPSDIAGLEGLKDPRFTGMHTEAVYDLLIEENPPERSDPPDDSPCTPDGSGGPEGDLPQLPGPDDGFGQDLEEPDTPLIERMSNIIRAKQAHEQSTRTKAGKSAGNLPGEIEMIIEKFLNPVLPWEVLLRNYLSELSNDDYSWRRPSRRHEDTYLPSLIGENALAHSAFFSDVSGSVTDEEILRCNSEAKSVFDDFSPERLSLVTFDHEIQNVYELYDGDDFSQMKITGRGGTCLHPVMRKIQELNPTLAVIFSDLYVLDYPEEPDCPVIWVVINNPEIEPLGTPPYGKVIHITAEQLYPDQKLVTVRRTSE